MGEAPWELRAQLQGATARGRAPSFGLPHPAWIIGLKWMCLLKRTFSKNFSLPPSPPPPPSSLSLIPTSPSLPLLCTLGVSRDPELALFFPVIYPKRSVSVCSFLAVYKTQTILSWLCWKEFASMVSGSFEQKVKGNSISVYLETGWRKRKSGESALWTAC